MNNIPSDGEETSRTLEARICRLGVPLFLLFSFFIVADHTFRVSDQMEQSDTRRKLYSSLSVKSKNIPTIPHIVWFTFKNNLLVTREPEDHFLNVLKTISAYRDAWNDQNAPVYFLDDDLCIEKIKQVQPGLVQYFEKEKVGAYKSDICRVAALYLHGGYYFDIDMEVYEVYKPDPEVKFVSTLSCNGGCFFQSFVAASKQHFILKDSIDAIYDVYRTGGDNTLVGPITMAQSYYKMPREEQNKVDLLQELQLDVAVQPKHYPKVPRQIGRGNCNFVVHDPENSKLYFFSRFLGAGNCLPGIIPREVWFSHETNILKSKKPRTTYRNVRNTVDKYMKLWEEPNTPVHFLDDKACQEHILKARPELYGAFKVEKLGPHRADLCSAAALFLNGGYYFDVDMVVVETLVPKDKTTFVATLSCGGWCFLRGFFACKARHPILEQTLLNMRDIYRKHRNTETIALGSSEMAKVFHALGAKEQDDVELLSEKQIENNELAQYGGHVRITGTESCNQVIYDSVEDTVYFFSHILGYGDCEQDTITT